MGATIDDKFATLLERPQRVVRFDYDFEIGKTPVTVAEWHEFRPGWCGDVDRQLPATKISHDDAVAYCQWLSERTGHIYRLPTEAEWEYCCRAGTASVFNTGGILSLDDANYLYSETGEKIGPGEPKPVGSYPPNAFGLHDMHGNVHEHVADRWHDGYTGAPSDGSAWMTPSHESADLYVLRGGAWDGLPRLLRSAHRDWITSHRRLDNVGFRVVRIATD
jgi:formylglycine-generating enzyme required for sulfatase activity